MAEFKHCDECKGSYGHHYPSCSKHDPDVEYRSTEDQLCDAYKKIVELEKELTEMRELLGVN